jgi:hypothetical protein
MGARSLGIAILQGIVKSLGLLKKRCAIDGSGLFLKCCRLRELQSVGLLGQGAVELIRNKTRDYWTQVGEEEEAL